jgi:hypothetical protein
MTQESFRRVALALPETAESAHQHHPDFRVAGKIFATLGYPDNAWGMVKLTPQQQAAFVTEHPEAFVPVKGAWGARGATSIRLSKVKKVELERALLAAWRNTAPKRLFDS